MTNQPISRRKKVLFYTILIMLDLFVCGGLYLGTIVWRSMQVYKAHSRWIGNPYRLDKNYGYFPEPYELAYHWLKHGERSAVIFNENGFRIPYPVEEPDRPASLRILFLGDSFTHGYGVPAEKSFAYLTATQLNASAMNAGGSGWGLSQMVMRARDAIPRFKPDIVVVQYSSWLPERSMTFYRSTLLGKSPTPYFYESDDGIDIRQPVFLKMPISQFAKEDKELFSFVWHVGLPLFLHDDYLVLRTAIMHWRGLLPTPLASQQKVIDYAYQEIQRLCSANDARMIILVLPRHIDDRLGNQLEAFSSFVVDVTEPLARELPEQTRNAWSTNFFFWRGDPPQQVDTHPNAHMHGEIAKILAVAIHGFHYQNPTSLTGSGR